MKKALWVLLTLAALAGGVSTQRWLHQRTLREGQAMLEAAFPDLDGRPHLLGEWKGKILIVNFWASWCPPCVEEMPEFAKLQQEFGPKGVQFVGILVDDEPDAARAFLKAAPVNYPILDGNVGGRAWASKLGDHVEALPFSVVFNLGGELIHTEIGRFSRDEVLAQIMPLLKPEK